MQKTHVKTVPLHWNSPSDPTRRCAVVSRCYFDTAIEVHYAVPILIEPEGLEWQRQQVRALFSEHRGHLSFGGAVNAGVGPVSLPAIEISLRYFQTLKALTFKWCLLRMAHPSFNFAFAIRIFNATRKGDCAVMGQHITIEWVERRVMNVRLEHSFTQIVEHDDTHAATQTTESFLMYFGPDSPIRAQGEQPHLLP